MHMRSTAKGHAMGRNDVPQSGLRLDPVPDVLAGAVRAWWRHDHPEYGWLALALLVAAADLTGTKTMSEAFRVASKHPISGPLVYAGWSVLTAHLFGLIPPKLDPLHKLGCPKRCSH